MRFRWSRCCTSENLDQGRRDGIAVCHGQVRRCREIEAVCGQVLRDREAWRCVGYQRRPIWLLALWIGVGFVFQGVSETALAVSFKELPERGWYIFVGVLTTIAGVVMLAWPISSIVVLSIIAGLWLVVIGTTEIVWAVNVRREAKKVERGVESLARGAVA